MFDSYQNSLELLTDLYLVKKIGMEDIGEKLGIDKAVVRSELVRCNIPIRPKGRPRFKDKQIQMSVVVDLDTCSLATLSIRRKAIKHDKKD